MGCCRPKPYTHRVGTSGIFQSAAFVIGLLFGSFLNVCISRLPRKESVVHPRSHCPQCGAPIRWYDNIPILSWVLLRGRCRACKRCIPIRYALVEVAVGLWFSFLTGQFFDLELAKVPRLRGPTPAESLGL